MTDPLVRAKVALGTLTLAATPDEIRKTVEAALLPPEPVGTGHIVATDPTERSFRVFVRLDDDDEPWREAGSGAWYSWRELCELCEMGLPLRFLAQGPML